MAALVKHIAWKLFELTNCRINYLEGPLWLEFVDVLRCGRRGRGIPVRWQSSLGSGTRRLPIRRSFFSHFTPHIILSGREQMFRINLRSFILQSSRGIYGIIIFCEQRYYINSKIIRSLVSLWCC